MGGLGLLLAAVWAFAFFVPSRHPRVSKQEVDYIAAGGGLTTLDAPGSMQGNEPTHAPKLSDVFALFRSRMLVGIFIAQYCITSITWFFVSWFPSYLVKGRGFTILEAGFIAALPAICGFVGGVSTGFFSDWLLRRTGNLTLARKIPITIGLAMSALMIACNYTSSGAMVIVLMSAAFFGKGFGSLGWTVVADTAPKEIIGLTGGVFNALGNTAGIVTPLVIGYILAGTGSFNGALIYVGAHGLAAIFCYWVVVGPIQRVRLLDSEPRPASVSVPA
jgi:nitrate/nitrite transporter NarK